MAADTKVAGNLLTATSGLGKTVFAESGDDARLARAQAVDFTQKLGDGKQPEPDFGQCFTDNFQHYIGGNMIKGGVVGIFGGPLGILGGAVVGFVGGAASGAIISGPARTAVTSAWDCL